MTMASKQELLEWIDALEVLRAHKDRLREPDISLIKAWEQAMREVEAEEAREERAQVSAVN
jgi:hypothetical protein